MPDAFISYSRKDKGFAEKLEQALEDFNPPEGLKVPQRHLDIFRDERDLTGTEYYSAIDKHLQNSPKLIVICSPHARSSKFVNDEIQRFIKLHSVNDTIPVLIAGIPNNEAGPGREQEMAFPEALSAAMEMPLATNYLDYELERDSIDEGRFLDSWYKLLSDIYDVSRSEIEQRDAKRRAQDRILFADELAAAALNNLAKDPELSVWLALHAVSATYSTDRTITARAEEMLHRALQNIKHRRAASLLTLSGHAGSIWKLAYSPDGASLVTVSEDGTWRAWDASTGEETRAVSGYVEVGYALIEAPSAPVKSLDFSPDGERLLTAQLDNRAKLWDFKSGKGLGSIYGHQNSVWDVAFSPDGNLAATASLDGTAKVWDLTNGEMVQEMPVTLESMLANGEITPVVAVAFSPDGTCLATAGKFGDARVWETSSGKVRLTLEGHGAVVNDITFSPDGALLATASTDGTTRIWSASDGKERLRISSDTPEFTGVAFSPDGKRLATANRDKVAEVWEVSSGRRLFTLSGHTGGVWGVCFSPDGKRLATASYDKTARVWDASPFDEGLLIVSGHANTVNALAFSPDGLQLVTGDWDGKARVWNVHDGRELLVISNQDEPIYCLAYSPDGKRLATTGRKGVAEILDASSGEILQSLQGHQHAVMGVAFSPDGEFLVTASYDKTARVWDLASGQNTLVLSGHEGEVLYVAYSPDGSRIATASKDTTARVWDAHSGDELFIMRAHKHPVNAVAFGPDGTQIVTASEDNTAKLWDTRSGDEIMTLSGHTSLVMAVAFSPDGSRVATGSLDKTVKVWQLSAPSEPLTLAGHSDEVWGVAFSPDGKRLATGSKDKTVIVYTLNIEDLLTFAKNCVSRELTLEERRRYLSKSARLGDEEARIQSI